MRDLQSIRDDKKIFVMEQDLRSVRWRKERTEQARTKLEAEYKDRHDKMDRWIGEYQSEETAIVKMIETLRQEGHTG